MAIDLLPGAKADLAELRRTDPDALATIAAFLQEANADPQLIDRCTTQGDSVIGAFEVSIKAWVAARRQSDNLFRVRILNTPATSYRLVYGYDWHTRRIGLLAVIDKEHFDYGITGDLADRIKSDWDRATGGLRT